MRAELQEKSAGTQGPKPELAAQRRLLQTAGFDLVPAHRSLWFDTRYLTRARRGWAEALGLRRSFTQDLQLNLG